MKKIKLTQLSLSKYPASVWLSRVVAEVIMMNAQNKDVTDPEIKLEDLYSRAFPLNPGL